MAIIFIDFARNLKETKTNSKSFYCYSLSDQYEKIRSRIPKDKVPTSTLEELIEKCFPTSMSKKYFLSCPNFHREKSSVSTGTQYLYNLVIRPEITPLMKRYLPNNTNLILFGDIVEGTKLRLFSVKGIELIDDKIGSSKDIVIDDGSYCCHSFGQGLSGNGIPYIRWTIDRPDNDQSIFTPDFIANLIKNCYPMSLKNMKKMILAHDEWSEYLQFRNKYLKQKAESYFEINQAQFITSYAISRQTYSRNASEYEDNLLVNHADFKKGDQILLNKSVPESEPFHLIRVDIDYNRKEYLSGRIEDRKGNLKNPNEKKLRAFTRENVALSAITPKNGNGDSYLREALPLDNRYKLILQDIEPDCTKIKNDCSLKIKEAHSNIDDRYRLILDQEIKIWVDDERQRLTKEKEMQLDEFDKNVAQNLDDQVRQNSDQKIRTQIEMFVWEKKKQVEAKNKKNLSNISKKDPKYTSIKQKQDADLEQDLNKYRDTIDIRQFYVDKNKTERQLLNSRLDSVISHTLEKSETIKRQEISALHLSAVIAEKSKRKIELEEERDRVILQKTENETIMRFSIFFKVETDNVEKLQKTKFEIYRYIIYDSRADGWVIRRQEQALENLYEGNVKNPYLATYLFAPDDLKQCEYDFSKWEWFLDSLNDKQQEAVQKAVSSTGLFLVQGPPGTGKTQVIAEIIGHLVKDNKKVLVASETHKAIDNVFDRLPLISDIRPLRLITSQSGKNSNFGPENLVDNFYHNIAKNMRKVIRVYEKFDEYKKNFFDTYQRQKSMYERIQRYRQQEETIQKQIDTLQKKEDRLKIDKSVVDEKIEGLKIQRDLSLRTKRSLERASMRIDEDIDAQVISDFIKEASGCLMKEERLLTADISSLIKELLLIDSKTLSEEISALTLSSNELATEQKISEKKNGLNKFKDEFGEWLPNTEQLRKPLQLELKKLLDNRKSSFDVSLLKIGKIIKTNAFNDISSLYELITGCKQRLIDIRIRYLIRLDQRIGKFDNDLTHLQDNIEKIERETKELLDQIGNLREDETFRTIKEDEARLNREISKFIEEFNVSIEYRNPGEAIEKIHTVYLELEANFNEKEELNKIKIPIIKKISDYLSLDSVIEADRREYTKPLFERVNLIGITTTSRDSFDEKALTELEKYNLGSIEIRKQGIDVVIIDEVSKSSFLELLIPILYGKTIILVGDHRQLPPMYEFRNLRNEDYENFDESVLTREQNERFMNLYERCFFKTLFEEVPDANKVMLTKQYRSHEHIMQVYNCFYNRKLEMGSKSQNNEKQHHLSIVLNNRTIIDPKLHVYFVNVKKFESKEADSTSIYNSSEADVVVNLLKLINDSYRAHPNFTPEVNKDDDNRMSVGVICTYSDQAKVIRQRVRSSRNKYEMFNEKTDSRLIISTVDDFQGDQRDIIILSMVRNPQNRANSNPGFINAYQRVNVALSRARRLLIVVGNRSYLEDKGVINLPDIDGNKQKDKKDFHVYEEVIGAIAQYGAIIDAEDIISGAK